MNRGDGKGQEIAESIFLCEATDRKIKKAEAVICLQGHLKPMTDSKFCFILYAYFSYSCAEIIKIGLHPNKGQVISEQTFVKNACGYYSPYFLRAKNSAFPEVMKAYQLHLL